MFIDILEKTLEEKNLTMNKLAKGINFSQSATSQWKNGRYPRADTLAEICKYLNVSADYLLELEPPPDLTREEQILLENYRAADERGKAYLLEFAQKEADRNKKQETLLNSNAG